jgi:voltage-gated potassium channel
MEQTQERAERMERRLEVPLLVAALLTVPAIILEESNTGPTLDAIAVALNWLIWLMFVAEVMLMLWVTTDRRRWLRTHPLELAITVLTPPLLPAGLQAARVFRLLRVMRLAKGAKIMRRLLSTEGIRDAAGLAFVTVLASRAAFSVVENGHHGNHYSAWDGIWWAASTVTTVGHGDEYPQTTAGRAIAIGLMLVGIGFVAILTAAAAERFMRTRRAEVVELRAVQERLDEVLRRLEALER